MYVIKRQSGTLFTATSEWASSNFVGLYIVILNSNKIVLPLPHLGVETLSIISKVNSIELPYFGHAIAEFVPKFETDMR